MEQAILYNLRLIGTYMPQLLQGAYLTLIISFGSIVLGLALGIVVAVMRNSGPLLMRKLASAYIEAIRNTPFLVQLFVIYFALPDIGIRFGAVAAGVITMVVNLGAYSAEIIRSGIGAINQRQVEAGEALGMGRLQIYRYIVLPQAIEIAYPSLTSQFILMLQASSLLSAISVNELTGTAQSIVSETFNSFLVYAVVGVLYILTTFILKGLFHGFGYAVFKRWRLARRAGGIG